MCLDRTLCLRIKEKFYYCKHKIIERTREVWCCFRHSLKRKHSDPINGFYNPYYDPNLSEVVVIPSYTTNTKLVTQQPKYLEFFSESSDDEIIFEKPSNKHIVEINEDNTFKSFFNNIPEKPLPYNSSLSSIPEDIDSSDERLTPSPEELIISSPEIKKNMEYDNLEEMNHKLSESKISVQSINLGEKDDNWDLVT